MNTFITAYLAQALNNTKRILASEQHVAFCYTAVTFLGDSVSCMNAAFPGNFDSKEAAAWLKNTIDVLEKEFPERMALSRKLAECQQAYDHLILVATGNYKNPLEALLKEIQAAADSAEDTPEEAVFDQREAPAGNPTLS